MTSRGVILPEKLPPTDRAAYFHGLRVHLQIVTWSFVCKEFESDNYDLALQWDWFENNGKLLPTTTDIAIAPPYLQKVIRCGCNVDSKYPCSASSRCDALVESMA